MKKTHSQFCEDLRTVNPSISIVGEYRNAKTKVDIVCNVCKHNWSAVPSSLLKGHGCPKCAATAGVEKQKMYNDQKNSLV